MKVELVDFMGSDLTVVNAARVSYGKITKELRDKDVKLLHYLAEHGHWTPFAHPQLSFRISTSISMARQLFRHQVGLIPNETSRRYVTDEPTFDLPEELRKAPLRGQSKQGSSEAFVAEQSKRIHDLMVAFCTDAVKLYDQFLMAGVAPEQARLILPMALVTEWIWTGSLMAFIRVCKDRLAPDAQAETRAVAVEIHKHLGKIFPESVNAWGL